MTLKATWPAAASRCRRERPCLSRWRTAKRPELQKRKGGEKEKEAFEVSNSPGSAESESCSGGQPSDRSYRKGKEERRRKKRLNCQILPAVPRARAARQHRGLGCRFLSGDVVDCVWLRFAWVAFGLISLAAWAKRDSWTLTGCGQELLWLKLERPEKGG
ncbi:uncharacterized protein LOC142092285 isoform X3 [Calonectris borealis]|uniref:uncharacterized protein LOC142092285 isoform X3 n=1 Tax=Calonectris borealis TaxID=1323832 RepID=UPI003F4C0D4E